MYDISFEDYEKCYDEVSDVMNETNRRLINRIKSYKDINKLENNSEVLLEVYGIIDLDNLYKIYNQVFEEIDKEIFDNYLLHLIIKDGPLTEVRVNDINYLTTMILDEIEAEEYVKSLTDEYKIYPKEFYFDVFNRRYLKNLKSSLRSSCSFFILLICF